MFEVTAVETRASDRAGRARQGSVSVQVLPQEPLDAWPVIDELQREVYVHDRELDTEEQESVVSCDELFRDGLVWTVRADSGEEFESRPATAQEPQRYLPAMERRIRDQGDEDLTSADAARRMARNVRGCRAHRG